MVLKKELLPALLSSLLVLLITACQESHLIRDREYLNEVEKRFLERAELTINRSDALFTVFEDIDLLTPEKEALKFLYSYMPLSDLADYDGEFYLANTRMALKARNDYRWSKGIPEKIFLHFVLPPRVNNENLDSFRIAYYDEIHDRLEGISDIEYAALEINHWCHEKVTYLPADIRTSAPLSTILSARGRCGEESTFTVAALRTAGIPSRQVYTPRWAHSDDNHAWVEVWIDGEWKYMGACEPEPILDRGWFTEPARRAMLVHTKVFGLYKGDEEVIKVTKNYAEINNLRKYAAAREIRLKVVGADGKTVPEAIVEFQLYNYAEFYPLATVETDSSGECRFSTGEGDLLVWARKNNLYGFRKVSTGNDDVFKITLGDHNDHESSLQLDMYAPQKLSPLPGITEELIKENSERLNLENSIREAYIDSWETEQSIINLCSDSDYDEGSVRTLVEKSMGNYKEITSFLTSVPVEKRKEALKLLQVINEKDLRDTRSEIMLDHLLNSDIFADDDVAEEIYRKYILNPRIDNEIIKPWRSYIQGLQNRETILAFRQDPTILVKWINENLKLVEEENCYQVPVTPVGVLELGATDKLSRKIFYIACCRSCGIPSRLEPGTAIPQYYKNGQWNNVYFRDDPVPPDETGIIRLRNAGGTTVPEYFTHFTLAKFDNGRYSTLQYDYNMRLTDFPDLSMPAGEYMLVTGNRIDDGRVLANVSFFTLKADEELTLDISLRNEPLKKQESDPAFVEKFVEKKSLERIVLINK
ncbi:MAG TPA: transglutaminase domain-containing protein [Bacteroidales bacterium]|nr:transglutaminase domain-containing protein [Bacteroidales bacterium]